MTHGQNLFDETVRNNLKTYDNIKKIATGQEDDYASGCFLDYKYFKNYHRSRMCNNFLYY